MERAVAVCTGHRCAALLDPDGPTWAQLRDAVRDSAGAVLVATGCTGACAQAPVLAVAGEVRVRRDSPEPPAGPAQVRVGLGRVTWLGPVEPWQVRALCRWLTAPDAGALPTVLVRAAFVPGAA